MNRNLLLFATLCLALFSNIAFAGWLEGWDYRIPITIDNTQNSNTLTDYQVLVTLDTASLISAGKMRSDCGDIRFTDSDGTTLLSYWIEGGCNSANTKIWVKVPEIPANSQKTIYVYYGNPSVASVSNISATFIIGDDFEDGDYTSGVAWSCVAGTCSITTNSINGSYGFSHTGPGSDSNILVQTTDTSNSKIYKIYFKVINVGTLTSTPYIEFNIKHIDANNFLRVDTYNTGSGGSGTQHLRILKREAGTYTTISDVTISSLGTTAHVIEIIDTGSSLTVKLDGSIIFNNVAYTLSWSNPQYTGFGSNKNTQTIFDTITIRKYTSPEPTTTLGNEEIGIFITIISPLNQTYFHSSNFEFSFKVEHVTEQTFWVKAFLDDEELYNNESYVNGTLVTLYQFVYDGTHNFTVWANVSDIIRSSSVIFTVEDYQIVEVTYIATVYETSRQSFSIVFRYNPDLVSNISSTLVWNGTTTQQSEQSINSTHITNTIYFDIPLIENNDTQVEFYFTNLVKYTNGSETTFDTQNYTQNVIFAYWIDSIASERSEYIEYEDATIKLFVKDLVGKANFSANITMIYNDSYSVTKEVNDYIVVGDTKIFSATFDVLETKADNETRNYSATLTISFGERSRVVNSDVHTLTVYKIILTNCSTYPTKALTIFVKDEETDNPILNATVEISIDVWKTGEIKRNYAWKFYLENRDNQSICIYPSWAEYTIDAMIQYYKPGYMDRTYYLYTNISNATSGVSLYLLNISLGDMVIIYVEDENGNKVQDAIVKVQRYYVGSNSYKTVAQVKTDFEGKGVTFLRVNEIYYRFIIEKNYVVLSETRPTIITCTAGGCPPYSLTLSVSEQVPALYFKYAGKIAYYCTINEETNILRCTVDDTSQLMQKARLVVEEKGALKFDVICDNVCESSACTLTCDLGNRTNKVYRYTLYAYFSEPPRVLEQSLLDYKVAIMFWGMQGLILAFILTGTLFFVGIWNPVVAMILAFFGILLGYLLGMVPVSISSLIGLGIAIAILIYKMRV